MLVPVVPSGPAAVDLLDDPGADVIRQVREVTLGQGFAPRGGIFPGLHHGCHRVIVAQQAAPAVEQLGPLGGVAHHQQGAAEQACLLLYATRVADD